MSDLGIVAIGRNEGERLRRCLKSVIGRGHPVVYVDSSSTDESVSVARSMGAEVVELDASIPFTAARARNAGFEQLLKVDPEVEFVQFVDGDCEVMSDWLSRARMVLKERRDIAVVFGRRHERHRDQTIYNKLADLEWDHPIGEAKACGGDAMILVEAFRRVGGYNPSIIAAEDDELCLRIRSQSWKVLRIDADMTLHDMAMTRFAQWWRRSVRCGHAYAEGVARYGWTPERHFVRQFRSTLFWGLLVPLLTLGLAWPTRGASITLLVGYVVLYGRTERYFRLRRGWPSVDSRPYAWFCVIAKFPQLVGVVKYWSRRLRGELPQIIEYRDASTGVDARVLERNSSNMTVKKDRTLNVGFVGAGYIADWHATALRTVKGAKLFAVCDRDEGRARGFAARYGVAHIYTSLDTMLSEGQVDAVHVLLPPESHAPVACNLIGAGLDVLLEKPMATSDAECEEIIEHVAPASVKCGVSHNFLFAPIYERLKADLVAGRLGRLDEVTITWNKGLGVLHSGPYNLWMLREPENIILEVGSHSVAHMLDLLGSAEILDVKATNHIDLPGGSRFFRRWRIDASCGSVGVALNFSFASGFSEHTIHVRGSLAAATVDFERNTYVLHRHRPAGLDFDTYLMTVSDAKLLRRQARQTLAGTIYSKLRRGSGNPYGVSIAQAMQAFYASPRDSLDARLSPKFGYDVVRACIQIGKFVSDSSKCWSACNVNSASHRPNDVSGGISSAPRPEILVLGATGFIGHELGRQLLAQGHSIRVLVRNMNRLPADLKVPQVQAVTGDLSSGAGLASALEGIRWVYHLARSHVKTWEEYVNYEIRATQGVAEACLTAKVDRLIYTGTIDSYYAGGRSDRITEETPLDPNSDWRNYYSRAKTLSERTLMELHQRSRLPVVIFRPGIVVGRGGGPLHWGIGMWSYDAICQLWGNGTNPLPLVLVEDVVSALLVARTIPNIDGQSFNLVADSGLTACDYLAALEDYTGVEFQKIPTPLWKFYLGEVAKWMVKRAIRHPDRRPPSYRDLMSRTQRAHYDCSKARKILGWRPVDSRGEMIRRGIQEPAREVFGGKAPVKVKLRPELPLDSLPVAID